MSTSALFESLRQNLRDIISIPFAHPADKRVLLVYDTRSALAIFLTAAYRSILPDASFLDFDQSEPEMILNHFGQLESQDLVILIQSTSFRLSKFRIRLELFNRKIKVIEHPHLARIQKDEQAIYVDSLAYDPSYYRSVGPELKTKIDRAKQIKIISNGDDLVYDSPFLDAKLNIGNYEGMKNIGGQFPIGEVFTEPKDLHELNGTVQLFAYGDAKFTVNLPEAPFTVIIKAGILISSPDAPEGFQVVLNDIREKEEVVWVRELGFGLNRAFTPKRHVADIGTYERMCGIHLSLGTKHLQYKKPIFSNKGGFHVDVFVDTNRVEIDGQTVYEDGAYTNLNAGR